MRIQIMVATVAAAGVLLCGCTPYARDAWAQGLQGYAATEREIDLQQDADAEAQAAQEAATAQQNMEMDEELQSFDNSLTPPAAPVRAPVMIGPAPAAPLGCSPIAHETGSC